MSTTTIPLPSDLSTQPISGNPPNRTPGQFDKLDLSYWKKYFGLRMAADAIAIADQQRLLAINTEQSRQFVNKQAGLEVNAPPEEDMAIHIGDFQVNYAPSEPPSKTLGSLVTGGGVSSSPSVVSPPVVPAAAPIAPAAVPASPVASGLSTLAKVAILAATLGSGAAIPLAVNALTPQQPAVAAPAPVQTPYDQLEYDLKLVPVE